MPLIVQSFTDSPDGTFIGVSRRPWPTGFQDTRASQSFLTTDSYTIIGVSLKLFQQAFWPAQSIIVSIRATVASGAPTGANLAVATVNVQNITLNPAGEWVEITFDASYVLSAATEYAIVVRCAGTEEVDGGATGWVGRNTPPRYAGGNSAHSYNGGASWSVDAFDINIDYNFLTLVEAVDVEKLSPGHNSVVNTGATTLLDWEDPGSGATKYSWTLTYEDPIWGTSVISGTRNAPTTEIDVSSAISTIYDNDARECTWKLRPYIGGEYVEDTDPWTLEIVGPPATAINPTPPDTDTSIAMAPLLQWELDGPFNDDDYFFIYLNTDITTMSTAAGFQQGWIISPKLQILSGLIANTTYYWQVHVANTQGWSESAIWSFTTRNFAPPAPTASTSPVSGESYLSGENNMLTVRRLIAAARNRIYYEDV